MTTPTQGEHAQPEALRTIAEWPITDPSNMDAVNMAAVARAALTAAPQGGAYAELPDPYDVGTGGGSAFSADQMRDFADRTHAKRASHGQAPTGATVAWCDGCSPDNCAGCRRVPAKVGP